MADVFISYKSERRAAAEHLAEILADYGYSVWWDYGLVSGRDFGAQIEQELRAAKAVVVLWCSLSRESEWVLDEATLAKNLGTIIPTMIERIDLPLGFGRAQTLDLSDWDGAPQSHKLDRLLRDIAEKVGRPPQPNQEGLDRTERAWRRFGAPSLAQFALATPLERQVSARTLPDAIAPPSATIGASADRAPQPPRLFEATSDEPTESRRAGLIRFRAAGVAIAILVLAIALGGYFLTPRQQDVGPGYALEDIDRTNPAALREFLNSKMIVGAQREEATIALNELEVWRLNEAQAMDTIDALQLFLNDFPNSSHALEINGRIAELRSVPEAVDPAVAVVPRIVGVWLTSDLNCGGGRRRFRLVEGVLQYEMEATNGVWLRSSRLETWSATQTMWSFPGEEPFALLSEDTLRIDNCVYTRRAH